MERTASVVWEGSLKHGKGRISTNSGALSRVNYNFGTRFENTPGTNPEELIAAAHASCFSMALSHILGEAGFEPEMISTTGTVTIEKQAENWTVTGVHLDVEARVPVVEPLQFEKFVDEAARGCPISRLLKAPISVDAKLETPESRSAAEMGERDTQSPSH